MQSHHALVFWPFVQSINYLPVFKLIYNGCGKKNKLERTYCSSACTYQHTQLHAGTAYARTYTHTMINDQAWVGSLLKPGLISPAWLECFKRTCANTLRHSRGKSAKKKEKETSVLYSKCSTYSSVKHGRITWTLSLTLLDIKLLLKRWSDRPNLGHKRIILWKQICLFYAWVSKRSTCKEICYPAKVNV